ncbi:MAG TPA: response regulator [Nitrospiraceae bacterium]|nr:response regulator [Nitrospiraceae bacterium]
MNARLLIVDDDPALLEALPDAVRARMDGVIVDISDSARAALDKIAVTDYDAIVSDIKMPEMDGLTLLAQARSTRPDTPILLITGHGEHDLAVQALRGGAYDFIQKPIDRDHFIASLSRAIQARQLRRQVEEQKSALAKHATELEYMVEERTRELVEANAAKDRFLQARDHALSEAKAAQRRLAILADASRVLVASLDYTATLEQVARFVVPTLADYCAVNLLAPNGTFRKMAIAHVDPSKEEHLHELYVCLAPDLLPDLHPVMKVLRTGQSVLYRDLADGHAHDAHYLKSHRDLGARSEMIVPLVARGRTIGVMTFGTAESGATYREADLNLAEELARRAALAVDNARLYSEAQDANRIKDEFLATVSHELRTPLTAILGWAQMLHGGKLDDATKQRALNSIERNAKSQAHLIEDLLDISRIITGKLRLDVRSVDLAPIIEAAIDGVRPAADAKGIRLQKVLDVKAGLISGDPDRLQQVLWNLLSNSIKFTPRGGRVQVCLERRDSQAQITVNDTGQGINAEFLPYMFDLFRQADSTITRQHGGLGLGLAIVRHVVEMHGGTVRADSSGEGHGATFTVTFPLIGLRPLDESATDPQPHNTVVGNGLSFDCAPALKGLHVLVVDDEPETRDLLVAVLSKCGAEVKASASAQDALEALREWRADVLVSDIGMPGEDGYDLIRKVRAMEPDRGGRIPAVALTAYARVEDRLRALSAGFQMHVSKPVEPIELAAVVASFAWRSEK